MTPEQQTPASVVERLRANTELLTGCDECVAKTSNGEVRHMIDGDQICLDLDAILAHVERLSAERDGLAKALEPFGAGEWGDLLPPDTPIFPAQAHAPTGIVAGDFRRARAALTQGESRQTGCAVPRRYANDDAAKVIYDAWSDLPGWVPWVEHGNSERQDMARRLVSLPAAPTPADGGGE
jgi:hypothetical protein